MVEWAQDWSRHRWEDSTGHCQFWGHCEEAEGKALWDSSAHEQLSPSAPAFLLFPRKLSQLLSPPGCLLLMNLKLRTTQYLESHQNPIHWGWGIFINSYAASKISTSYNLASQQLGSFQKNPLVTKQIRKWENVSIRFVLLYQNIETWNFINKKFIWLLILMAVKEKK